MRLKSKDVDAVRHACLLVVGPEPLTIDNTPRGAGAPTPFWYKAEVEGFNREFGIDDDPWNFINWQRRLYRD